MNGSGTISVPINNVLFNFRVAGIAIENEHILLHKKVQDNYWCLPGGRVDIMERTEETLVREIKEELNKTSKILALSWISENCFIYNSRQYHEIGFYYHIKIDGINNFDDMFLEEDGHRFVYRWFPIEELSKIDVYPQIISKENLKDLDVIKHFTLENLNLNEKV